MGQRIYVAITVIASFTFMGNQLKGSLELTAATLKSNIESINAGYADYQDRLEDIVRQSVLHELVQEMDADQNSQSAYSGPSPIMPSRFDREIDDYSSEALDYNLKDLSRQLTKISADFRGEYNRLITGIPDLTASYPLSTRTSPREDGSWSKAAANDLAADIKFEESMRAGDLDADLIELVDMGAVLSYDALAKPRVDLLLAAAGVSPKVELAKILLEQLLYKPIEEYIKTTAERLFEETTLGKADPHHALTLLHQRLALKARIAAVRRRADPLLASLKEYSDEQEKAERARREAESTPTVEIRFDRGTPRLSMVGETTGKPKLDVKNATEYVLEIVFTGPDVFTVKLAPRAAETRTLTPGSYRQDAHVFVSNVRDASYENSYEMNVHYRVEYFLKRER